jgi:hypothetical protein
MKDKNVLVYKNLNIEKYYKRIVLKFLLIFKLPLNMLFDEWKVALKRNDVKNVIVFINKGGEVVEYILKKKRKDQRVILWYWNPAIKCINPDSINYNNSELWSFDTNDCLLHNMSYNTTFYFDNIYLSNRDLLYDILFVGKDKGRMTYLKELERELIKKNIRIRFEIVSDNKKTNKSSKKETIPYEKVLELISESKAILDICQDGQDGMTLRPLEALFLKKKLITNYSKISNFDFYHPNNIFILGIDNIDDLKYFIETPYISIPYSIINQYDFSSWLKRFGI